MGTADSIIINVDGQETEPLALKRPQTIAELWATFTKLGQRPQAIALPFNSRTARITF